MSRYEYESAQDWLDYKIKKWDHNQLKKAFRAILPQIDNDTIQNLFQNEMDLDGFFEDLDEVKTIWIEKKEKK